jgi:hypothetical protein
LAFFLLSPGCVQVIDDPLDPVFVTVGPSLGRVELQIGEGSGARYSRMPPSEARRVAKALLQAAEDIEGKIRPR